jgi:hypothetical protein
MRINTMHADTLVTLAATAKRAGVTLTIKGSMHADSMVRIAAAGKGHVVFDIADG